MIRGVELPELQVLEALSIITTTDKASHHLQLY